jgi:hypothetical protein
MGLRATRIIGTVRKASEYSTAFEVGFGKDSLNGEAYERRDGSGGPRFWRERSREIRNIDSV